MTYRDQQRTLLLVEDDPAAALLVRLALEEAGAPLALEHVASCEAARLRMQRVVAGEPAPDLVLLDLNLGDGSGHELLAEWARLPALADVPLVMLSTSAAEQDRLRALAAGAAAYLVKPDGYDALVGLMDGLRRYLRVGGRLARRL